MATFYAVENRETKHRNLKQAKNANEPDKKQSKKQEDFTPTYYVFTLKEGNPNVKQAVGTMYLNTNKLGSQYFKVLLDGTGQEHIYYGVKNNGNGNGEHECWNLYLLKTNGQPERTVAGKVEKSAEMSGLGNFRIELFN